MTRRGLKQLAGRHLPFLAGGAGVGGIAAAVPWPWTVTAGVACAVAFTRGPRAERIRERFAALSGPATAAAAKTRARTTTRRAEQSIPERWPSLMAELGFADAAAGAPTLDAVTVTPDVIDAQVTMPVKWGPGTWRKYAAAVSGALGGQEVDVQVEPVDPRDPGAPRRLGLTIDKRGLPDRYAVDSPPAFLVDEQRGDGVPVGVGVAGRPVVWWIDERPHLAIAADTRTGKSAFLRFLISTVAAHGCTVDAISGKTATAEWHNLDQLGGVTYHRNATAEFVAIREATELMQARYAEFDRSGTWHGVTPHFVIIDELAQWIGASKAKGRMEAAQAAFNLVSQGGEARIHFVGATHRWNLDQLGNGQASTAREQMGGIQIGRASRDALRMVLGDDMDPDVDADIPDLKGRAIVGSLGRGLGTQVCQLAYLDRVGAS